MPAQLTDQELASLIKSVFAPTPDDRRLALITDVPNTQVNDNTVWKDRREIVNEWNKQLKHLQTQLNFDAIGLFAYENVGSNNADLPEVFYEVDSIPSNVTAEVLPKAGKEIARDMLLQSTNIIIAATEYSATAPLKILGRKYGFRAATMPGFSRMMLPALGLDYERVHKRVMTLKTRLDKATAAEIVFIADGTEYQLYLDLRFRTAHASSGLLREKGIAANLPSGETYIVPYEGERENEPSRTEGKLPARFDNELVVFRIENNRAVKVIGSGIETTAQKEKLRLEPAYGNIAELGLGVLDAFGIEAVGSVLLDEKLGLHVAFGRSEHFGGITGPDTFQNPKNVIHHDYVYVPSLQPGIVVKTVKLLYGDGKNELIMVNNEYVV